MAAANRPPSVAGFGGVSVALATTTASANVALPSDASIFPVVEVINDGTAAASVLLGNTSSMVASATCLYVPAGKSRMIWAGAFTYIAGITGAGSTTLRIQQWTAAPSGD